MSNEEKYWDSRWKDNQTGWDIGYVSPPIKAYMDAIENKELVILIPGCGNAYEAAYLLEKGFKNVTVVDISQALVDKLNAKFKGRHIKIECDDFFLHKGRYELIIEQTFFCAIDPAMRLKYVDKCYELLQPKGKIAGLLFNTIFEKEGPPYGGSKEEYVKLFSDKFDLLQIDTAKNSIPPRQGNELFIEFEKKG